MSNAATSALRLHQRIPRVAFTREFLATLLLEDSAHYLLYSVMFLYAGSDPVTVALLPGEKADAGSLAKAVSDAGYDPVETYSMEAGKLQSHVFVKAKKSQ